VVSRDPPPINSFLLGYNSLKMPKARLKSIESPDIQILQLVLLKLVIFIFVLT